MMASQSSLDRTYMECAEEFALLSRARRKKVGAIIVTPEGIMIPGFNGTPSGFDNNCEDERLGALNANGDIVPIEPDLADCYKDVRIELITKPEVLHAESNALSKVSMSRNTTNGATIYITCSPCFDCSKLIIQAGIDRVVYQEEYRNLDGINFLGNFNIEVCKLP